MQTQPNYAPALCMLGLIDAALGRKEDALREGTTRGRACSRGKGRADRSAYDQIFGDDCGLGGRKGSRL